MTISANSGSFDRILDQFEERWKAYLSDGGMTECPRLEQYLPAAGAPDARELVWELISLDLYYRMRTDESESITDRYVQLPGFELSDREKGDLRALRDRYRQAVSSGADSGHYVSMRMGRAPKAPALILSEKPKPELAAIEADWRRDLAGTATTPSPDETLRVKTQSTHAPVDLDESKKLGVGGMGVVYRDADPILQRDVAIKVLHARHHHPDGLARFVKEAHILARLEHPGIVPIHTLGYLPDGRPYFSMKIVKGTTLTASLRQRQSPSDNLARFIGIFEQVCQALAYAHSKNVLHRDLKPDNVMVGDFGEVLLMDWGLGKLLQSDEIPSAGMAALPPGVNPELTGQAAVMGTLAYIPPEQARGMVKQIDKRTDVFGLGGILCEILTNAAPYRDPDAQRKAMSADLTDAAQRLDRCGADPELVAIAHACLAVDQKDRPADAEAVAKRIAQYQANVQKRLEEAKITQAKAQETQARLLAEQKRLRVLRWAIGLGVGLFLLITSVGWWETAREIARIRNASRLAQDSNEAADRIVSLRNDARIATPGDFRKWTEALALAKQTEGRLVGTDVDESVKQRVSALVRDLEQESRARSMAFWLEEARLRLLDFDAGNALFQAADDDYAAAFRKYGIDPEVRTMSETAARISISPIKEQLVQALDWWNLAQRGNKKPDAGWRRLTEIARRVDPDPLRNRMRDLWTQEGNRGDVIKELRRLAADDAIFERSPSDLSLLMMILDSPASEHVAFLKKAQQHHPDDVWINLFLAEQCRRLNPPQWDDVVRYTTAAVALRSKNPMVHSALATALYHKGDLDGAVASFRQSLRLNPKNPITRRAYASFLVGKGHELAMKGDFDRAIAAFREAAEVDSDNALAPSLLGNAMAFKGDLHDAIASFRQALRRNGLTKDDELKTRFALGEALVESEDLPEAVRNFESAIRLDEESFPARLGLGKAQLQQGRFSDALITLERARALSSGNLDAARECDLRIKECRMFLDGEKLLPAVLAGATKVTDAEDYLAFAELCRHKQLYGASAAFYVKAFEARPSFADDLTVQDRYHAARVAALAGSGKGEDAAKLDPKGRAAWRHQAIEWLRADLKLAAKQLEARSIKGLWIHKTLRHWQQVPSLAGIRDQAQLENLPAAERAACEAIWAEAVSLLKKAASQ
jgi:serine/threonine-protein kinase